MSKKSLERLGRYTSQWFTHVGSWERPPAAVLKGCAGCIHLAHHYSVATVRTLAHSAPAAGVSHEARQLTLGLRSPAPLLAAAVRSPAHRRAARAGDIACRTSCLNLSRLASSSPPARSACRPHAPRSFACRLLQPPWSSPRACSACRARAQSSEARCLEPPWGSPPPDTACPRRARRSSACRLEPPWSSPRAGSAFFHCPHHARSSAAFRVEQQ